MTTLVAVAEALLHFDLLLSLCTGDHFSDDDSAEELAVLNTKRERRTSHDRQRPPYYRGPTS